MDDHKIEFGFIEAFFYAYYKHKIEKDKQFYTLNNTNENRDWISTKIEDIKIEIERKGFIKLSLSYMVSTLKTSSRYIEPERRFDYWINQFSDYFKRLYYDASSAANNWIAKKDNIEVYFDIFSNDNVVFRKIKDAMPTDGKLENTDLWHIDIENFEVFAETNEPIKILFNLCELFVLLNHFDTLTELLPDRPEQPRYEDKYIVESPKKNESDYQRLSRQLNTLFMLVDFLCPNSIPSDIFYLEKNIKIGKTLYDGLKKINVFENLEALHFEGKPIELLITRVNKNLKSVKNKWYGTYNDQTFERAKGEVLLYKSDELQSLIYWTDGIFKNVISEINNFEGLYLKPSQQPNDLFIRKILFLTANPIDEEPLRLEGELRKVLDTLNGATHKMNFDNKIEPAVRIDTITRTMETQKPEIVHFSGHGCIEGLTVEDYSGYSDLFPIEGLDRLFRLFNE